MQRSRRRRVERGRIMILRCSGFASSFMGYKTSQLVFAVQELSCRSETQTSKLITNSRTSGKKPPRDKNKNRSRNVTEPEQQTGYCGVNTERKHGGVSFLKSTKCVRSCVFMHPAPSMYVIVRQDNLSCTSIPQSCVVSNHGTGPAVC